MRLGYASDFVCCVSLGADLDVYVASICSTKRNAYGDPGAGSLLTLFQFLIIAAVLGCTFVGVVRATGLMGLRAQFHFATQARRCFLKKTTIPLKYYVLQAALFFSMSFLNNIVFSFHISQPVHLVVRSSNLVITVLLGLYLRKKYASMFA